MKAKIKKTNRSLFRRLWLAIISTNLEIHNHTINIDDSKIFRAGDLLLVLKDRPYHMIVDIEEIAKQKVLRTMELNRFGEWFYQKNAFRRWGL